MVLTAATYPCLGISALGICAYDPAHPVQLYFTIGDAIAALGFTLAIQQLFKPIYLFRVRAYRLRLIYLPMAVFLGALCSVVAMLLPNVPISHRATIEYPLFWEFLGWLLIILAYSAVAFISFVPTRIYSFNLPAFSRAAARLLSAASDDDRAAFADDLFRGPNIERLVGFASAWEKAEHHEVQIEFERLQSIGAPLQFTGRPPISAFYRFAHRRELEAASVAGTFLQILSDPEFCSVLVRKCPWLTADVLVELAEKELHVDQARPFVQEIGRQAIANEDSMMAKEAAYTGFATVPHLSNSLFGNWHILHYYDPMRRIGHAGSGLPSASFVDRLNSASKLVLKTAIRGGEFWPQGYMHSVESAYENLSMQAAFTRPRALPTDYLVRFHSGIQQLYEILLGGLDELEWPRKKLLFVTDPKEFRTDLVSNIAKTTYDSIECFANAFSGIDDDGWFHTSGVYQDIYRRHGSSLAGMNPLQQQLALRLISKLRDNMEGWYPAISRILIAVVGPYECDSASSGKTAQRILSDAIYKELQKLPMLYAKHPEKFADFLPPNVSYDPQSNSLIHTYRWGATKTTNLSAIDIPDVDLTNEHNWTQPTPLAVPEAQPLETN